LRGAARLAAAVRLKRYSVDCTAYGLLALGTADVVVEARQAPWDYLPLVPIVAGAGGALVGWDGGTLRLTGTQPGSSWAPLDVVAVGDPSLLPEVCGLLCDPG
jgi:fructose-1,6-bisphosphatase/inositol monophosphatase family enzyme